MKENELKTMHAKVKALLIEAEKYRDSDKLTVARVWADELRALGKDVRNIAALEMVILMINGAITKGDNITRCWRKVLEHNPELRGAGWEARHNKETKKVKRELREIRDEQIEHEFIQTEINFH